MEAPADKEVKNPKIAQIDNDNFIDYLMGLEKTSNGLLRGDLEDFESRIEVPEEIHQVIKEMYEQKRETVTGIGELSEQFRDEFVSQIEAMLPGVGDEMKEQKDVSLTVEQARVVFIDRNLNIKSTSPEYGHGNEVDLSVSFNEARQKGGLPIMAIHTHPEDSNFSFFDYRPLILGNPHEKVRLFNSMVVLCPDMQVMAVVTKDTPIFSNEKADELVMDKMNETKQKDVIVMGKLINSLQQLSKRKLLVDKLMLVKSMAGDKYPNVVDKALRDHDVQGGELDNIQKAMDETMKASANEIPRRLNSDLIKFSREMHVKLYFSQDMRTFKEFSA